LYCCLQYSHMWLLPTNDDEFQLSLFVQKLSAFPPTTAAAAET
jgi:hypothetical protein